MKKAFPLLVFIILMISGGCSSPEKEIVDFPVAKNAFFTATDIGNQLVMPINLLILGEDLLIHDAKSEWLFKGFSRHQLQFTGNLLRRGRGPLEEVNVIPQVMGYTGNTFLYQNPTTLKVAGIRHDDDQVNLEVTDRFELPAEMVDDYDLFLLDGKLCSTNSWAASTTDFRCFHLDTDSVYEWGELLPMQRPASLPADMPFMLQKKVTVRPGGSLMAVAYETLSLLRIYDTRDGRMLHELQMADDSANRHRLETNLQDGNTIYYYLRVKSTSEYLFALHAGDKLSWEGENIPDIASVLHIWKWDGTPVMSLQMDRPVFSFDITPDNKQIIASSIVDTDKLFVADIPW